MGLEADIRKCSYDPVLGFISGLQVGVETDLKGGFYGGREKGNLRILLGFYGLLQLSPCCRIWSSIELSSRFHRKRIDSFLDA